MGSCELKNELDILNRKQSVLLNIAKNEVAISSILMSKDELVASDTAMLNTLFGKTIADQAIEIHKLHVSGSNKEEIVAAVTSLKKAMDSDEKISFNLSNFTVKRPDPKYSIFNFNVNKRPDGQTIAQYFNNIIATLLTPKQLEARANKLKDAVDAAKERMDNATRGSKEHVAAANAYALANHKLSGIAIKNAIDSIPKIVSNDNGPTSFPEVYAVTQTYDSKGSDDESIEHNAKGKHSREKEKTMFGYISGKIKNLVIRNNTIESEHDVNEGANKFSSDYNDEVSMLAVLFGTESHKNKDGTIIDKVVIPDYVKNSIKINSLSIMADIYKLLSHEIGSREFDNVWGLDNSSNDYYDSLVNAEAEYLNGSIPQTTVLTSLGKSIYQSLPISFSKELDLELEQAAVAQLGLYALRYMSNINLIRIEEKPFKHSGDNRQHILITANNGSKNNSGIVSGTDIMNLVSELQYIGVSDPRKAPRPLGDEYEVSQTIRNSFLPTSEIVKENLKSSESVKFKFNDHMALLYAMYNNPDGGKESAYAFTGVLSVDTSKSVMDQMKEMSKINYSKMQIDEMMKTYEQFHDNKTGENAFFTLPYDYTVSTRYMVDSIFNPQESKISRFLVTSKDLDSVLSIDENGLIEEKDLELFNVGLAQGFDLDPDKTTDINAIKNLNKIVKVNSNGSVEFTKEYNGEPNVFKALFDMLGNGLLNGDITDKMRKTMMEVNRAGSGFHAVQSVMALRQLHDAAQEGLSKSITLSFSMETDAITSGMILTLLQIGTPKALALAAKGGVYTEETIAHWKNMYDLYHSAGGKMVSLEQDGKFKLTHGWLRDFSKDFKTMLDNNEFLSAVKDKLLENDLLSKDFNDQKDEGLDIKSYLLDQSSFNDFYETVASTSNNHMKKILIEKKNDLIYFSKELEKDNKNKNLKPIARSALVKKINDLSKAIAVINIVGDVSRKLAKPSVMVYIYGAMMNSIKRNMLTTVVMPKIYDIFLIPNIAKMSYNKLVNDITNNQFVFIQNIRGSILDSNPNITNDDANDKAYLYFEVMSMLLKGTPALQFKKLNGNSFIDDTERLMGNVIIPEKVAMRFRQATDDTLGVSFEEGFKDFEEINMFREAVKSAEVVRFTMFKYELKKGLDKIIKRISNDGNYKISSRDVSSVINNLEKSGFGHSVNDINGGKQPLYRKDSMEKEIRTMLALMISKDGKYLLPSASLESKGFVPNTGASSVIIVHNIDAYIDGVSARMFDLIRIYDGSVSGINKIDKSIESYNKVLLETTSWNSYNKQVNDLTKQINILVKNGEWQAMLSSISDIDKDNLLNTVETLFGYGDITEGLNARYLVEDRANKSKARYASNMDERRNGNRILSIMHSYLTDSARLHIGKMDSGSKMTVADGNIDKVYSAYGDILIALQAYKLSKDINKTDYDSISESATLVSVPSDKKYKKGTPTGGSNDVKMRSIANTSIVELDGTDRTSSSRTTEEALPWDINKAIGGIVMLARNGTLAGQDLDYVTTRDIMEAHDSGATFVVGDMPNVDTQFINFLNRLHATYSVYYEGKTPRISIANSNIPTAPVVNTNTNVGIHQLKWLNKDSNIIVNSYNDENSSNIKINSIDELVNVSEQFHKLMMDKYPLDNTSKDDGFKHIEWFKELLGNMSNEGIAFKPITIKFIQQVTLNKQKVAGSMDYNSDTMKLTTGHGSVAYPIKIIVHEYAHAITSKSLLANPALLTRVKAIMDSAKSSGLLNDPKLQYAFTNEVEFLAEVMSNPLLQSQLLKIESIGNSGLDKLKKIFNYLLKHFKGEHIDSLLHDSLEVILDLNGNIETELTNSVPTKKSSTSTTPRKSSKKAASASDVTVPKSENPFSTKSKDAETSIVSEVNTTISTYYKNIDDHQNISDDDYSNIDSSEDGVPNQDFSEFGYPELSTSDLIVKSKNNIGNGKISDKDINNIIEDC